MKSSQICQSAGVYNKNQPAKVSQEDAYLDLDLSDLEHALIDESSADHKYDGATKAVTKVANQS